MSVTATAKKNRKAVKSLLTGRKAEKRYAHYSKNALRMHAKRCHYPGSCGYGLVYGTDPGEINDAAVIQRHHDICLSGPGPHDMVDCRCWEDLQAVDCMAAVDAENASAEIERHLAAIRKIKRTGKPLRGKESYRVFPE